MSRPLWSTALPSLTVLTLGACGGELPLVGVPGDDDGATGPVFTEVMVQPTHCSAAEGQYVELYNPTDVAVDLSGYTLSDGTTTAVIAEATLAPRSHGLGVPQGSSCWGPTPAFSFSGLTLATGTPGATLALAGPAGLVDAVPMANLPAPQGASVMLEPSERSTTGNDDATAWCPSSTPIAGTSDLGTPGSVNPRCSGSGVETGAVPLAELEPGDLVITEVMFTPQSCGDVGGQYVEIANVSGRAVDLSSLRLSDGGATTIDVTTSTILTPNTRGVLFVATDGPHCFADGAADIGTWDPALVFDEGDAVVVGHGDPIVPLDSAPAGAWPMEPGVALELSDAAVNSEANDGFINWCPAQDRIVPGSTSVYDLGTPGGDNGVCPPIGEIVPARTGGELEPGDLVITEVMYDPSSCPDFGAEYFEVYNASGVDLDLTGLLIVVDDQITELTLSYPVAADSYAVAEFANASGPGTCYTGLTPQFVWASGEIGNNGGTIELRSDNTVVDLFDFTDVASTPGRALQLTAGELDPTNNDDLSRWCPATTSFTGSKGDKGSPGAANEDCDGGVADTAVVDTAPPIPTVPASTLQPGELIITEFLADPQQCQDYTAEWIEVYNPTDDAIDLTGLFITIDGSAPLPISNAFEPILAHSHGTLRYGTNATPSCYGASFTMHGRYQSDRMDNDGPLIVLSNGNGTLDAVNAVGWSQVVLGASAQLDPAFLDADANDDPAAWCTATQTWPPGFLDLGSPGAPNPWCFPPDTGPVDTADTFLPVDTAALADTATGPGDDTADTDLPPDTASGGPDDTSLFADTGLSDTLPVDTLPVDTLPVDTGPVDTGPDVVTVDDLSPGDLLITEFMAEPVDCPDFRGEYLEIVNTTPFAFDPTGLRVTIGGATDEVLQVNAPLAPGAHGTLRYTTGSTTSCYGLPGVATYTTGKVPPGGTLIRLESAAGTVIDEINTAGWSTIVDGQAAQLDPAHTTATGNDDPANWCPATVPIPTAPGTDRGTPDAPNVDGGCLP